MANNYKGRKIHSYSDYFKTSLLTELIKDAEKVEKQRFTEICNKDTGMNMDFESWLSVYPNWKQEYKNQLRTKSSNPLSKKQQKELAEITQQLTQDILKYQKNINNIIAMGLTEIELQNNKEYTSSVAFKGGLEIEKDIVTDKYAMIKNLDTKAIFRETQGNWRAELSGDYSWSFNKSQIEHWGEIKSNLNDFHITGSQDIGDQIFTPIIDQSHIIYNQSKDEYTISVPVPVKEQVGRELLLRKYNLTGSFPVYESPSEILLCSELFQLFLNNEVALYKQPAQKITMSPQEYHSFMDRTPEMWIAEWDTEETIKKRQRMLRSLQKTQNKRDFIEHSLQKYNVSLHLWYSKR